MPSRTFSTQIETIRKATDGDAAVALEYVAAGLSVRGVCAISGTPLARSRR
jgi:hypothetical protein